MLLGCTVPNLYFDGILDEIKIFNNALNQTAIRALMEGPIILHYSLDEIAGTVGNEIGQNNIQFESYNSQSGSITLGWVQGRVIEQKMYVISSPIMGIFLINRTKYVDILTCPLSTISVFPFGC